MPKRRTESRTQRYRRRAVGPAAGSVSSRFSRSEPDGRQSQPAADCRSSGCAHGAGHLRSGFVSVGPATEVPSLAELRAYRLLLLEERRLLGLEALDPDEFAREFRLMTIQRGLKAIGTFSYQTAVCNRGAVYEQFIEPTLVIVLQAADWLDRFPALRRMIRERTSLN